MRKPPSTKQLHVRSIYTALAIGFLLLLGLIWAMGALGTSKLSQINVTANKSATDYSKRVAQALNIRQAVVEVAAEVRVNRARRGLKVPAPPLGREFAKAKNRFREEIENGKRMWGGSESQEALSESELNAWREVEAAAERFWKKLIEIENLPIIDDPLTIPTPEAANPPAGPGGQNATPQETPLTPDQLEQQRQVQRIQFLQIGFSNLRMQLDSAAEKLTEEAAKSQNQILFQLANQRQKAATEVGATQYITLLIGFFVAVLTFAIVGRKIAQLRRANRLEQEAKDFARSVFDSQSNDIIVVNRQGELLAVNQAFLNHCQLPAPSLVLQDYAAALAHLPEISAFVRRTLEDTDEDTGRRERIEVKPRRDFGDPNAVADARLFDVYISPLTSGGQPSGRVIVLVDVTEAERVREELRLSRSLSAVGQITATVAHELYNPIGAVKLNIDLLEMQVSGDEDVKHTIARLKRGVEHLSTIVMELRYLTRPRDPERKPTDLNKLLDEVVELAGDRLERSRVFVARKYSSWLPHGQFDPQQLRKVFLNLLINAVEASPQNSDVELHTHYISGNGASPLAEVNGKRGAVIISVIDHGVGMSPETKRRLFEAFYTTKRNGTGLGMMITQEIVKKHGGKIEVESEEGKGTTVNVYLPV
jgi:signal transduction histidine kinase